MTTLGIFLLVGFIFLFIVVYRKNTGDNVYKFIAGNLVNIYEKYAPYSFKSVREKVIALGQEYTPRQYAVQIAVFALGAFVLSYLYFYSILVALFYATVAVSAIPYLSYLRYKRIYSEFIFEQIQVYTTNVIMEFATTQAFVKSLEGVYESGVLEDPVKSDVQKMIDMAYESGTIEGAIEYMNSQYDYFIVRNMHQLFLQITNEGSKDAGDSLENMSMDIDMLVESVYRDRIDRSTFHRKFLQFGVMMYLMVMLVQFLLGNESYIQLLNDQIFVPLLIHTAIIVNTYFLLTGEKYYNENVGVE